jgi:hypothetical protein
MGNSTKTYVAIFVFGIFLDVQFRVGVNATKEEKVFWLRTFSFFLTFVLLKGGAYVARVRVSRTWRATLATYARHVRSPRTLLGVPGGQ